VHSGLIVGFLSGGQYELSFFWVGDETEVDDAGRVATEVKNGEGGVCGKGEYFYFSAVVLGNYQVFAIL
jgi:hypothetical protein